MSRIIALSMVVFITIVAVGLGSANAQPAPGNPWCDAKWTKSGKSAAYQDFMDSCLRLVHGEQLSPAAWKQWQQWQSQQAPAAGRRDLPPAATGSPTTAPRNLAIGGLIFGTPQQRQAHADFEKQRVAKQAGSMFDYQKTEQRQAQRSSGPNWDPELEARSHQIFDRGFERFRYHTDESERARLLWLQEQENLKLDQQRDHSYSYTVRAR